MDISTKALVILFLVVQVFIMTRNQCVPSITAFVGDIERIAQAPQDLDSLLVSPSIMRDSSGVSSSGFGGGAHDPNEPFRPLDCDKLRFHATKKMYEKEDANGGELHVVRTSPAKIANRKIKFPFWISLHDKSYDSTRWAVKEERAYYEFALSQSFEQIFESKKKGREQQQQKGNSTTATAPPLRMIDVGGNIGWFTLLSMSAATSTGQEFEVRTFEPNPRNQLRFCESLHLNGWWDRRDAIQAEVKLYPYGVTNSELAGTSISMQMKESGTGSLLKGDPHAQGEAIKTVSLVSLDDMNTKVWKDDPESRILILKVDVEGLEFDVFQGATKLIQSGRVENIFFEGNLRAKQEVTQFESLTTQLVKAGYRLYKIGGWMGPRTAVKTKLNENPTDEQILAYVDGLKDECKGGGKNVQTQCNLWWRHIDDDDAELEAVGGP